MGSQQFILVYSFCPPQGNGINDGSVTSILTIDSETSTRSYSANGYLEPNLERENLLVLTEAQVTKVILSPWYDVATL